MTAVVGLVSFAGAFAFAWFTKKTAPASQGGELNVARGEDLLQPEATITGPSGAVGDKMNKAMMEKQLKSLIYNIQEKMQAYNDKLQNLHVREQRLQTAHSLIKKDLEELNNLRIELASTVASLKSERDKLLKSRVEIAQTEKANLMSIAATYDKMKPIPASKILANISRTQDGKGSYNLDDAVKILHYMTERTKAKLLAELVTSEPKLAAALTQKLKQIVEKQ
jgi:flagellar motility protein MotE (MotC chaperone)